ncbi:MAG: DEAD/DEAH box helicase [Bacteroidales bacterium]|jgi:ATP-dependent RNA helicase DeaD|nr:DEAD/DEAH box helicase [Bacteroidales bacterium]
MKFDQLGLKPNIQQALDKMGFIEPTPIQELAIPFLLEQDKDLVANAQTGTGKTAAFGLPILEQIDNESLDIQALILSPTRELALQIAKDMGTFSAFIPKLKVIPVYGGASIETQISALKRGGQIVVGTPGRMLDLIKRRRLNVERIKYLVLDEADEMLSMGFKEELDEILANTPKEKQTMLFSATMPKGIANLARNYMGDYHEITVGTKNSGAKNVEHIFYQVAARDKYAALKRLADIHSGIYGIVFCRTRMETKEVADKLMADGYNADALHGDLSQDQRDKVMGRFRKRKLQILVATDVAARGLDVDKLTHVINYNIPDDNEIYIHRSGRTGRAGEKGISISLIHSRERGKLRDMERKIGKDFERKQIPGGAEICNVRLFNLIEKVEKIEVNTDQIGQFLPAIYEKLESLSREELIQHFVSYEFNAVLKYYKNAPDLNVSSSDRSDRGSRSRDGRDRDRGGRDNDRGRGNRDRGERRSGRDENRGSDGYQKNKRAKKMNMSRFHINVGSKDKLNPGRLMGMINDSSKLNGVEIGDIEILKKFSFFEVDQSKSNEILELFNNKDFQGVDLKVELTKSKSAPSAVRQDSSGRSYTPRGENKYKKENKPRRSSRRD